MSKRRAVFVINPHAGISSKGDMPLLIDKYLDHTLFDHEIHFTEYAGHAAVLAAAAAQEGAAVVVAVGGDGTVNEVARSIVHTATALAIIPCGSGNGLARHLLLPINTAKCLAIINAFEVQPLDYGTIDGHPFFCTCGVGFDAFISHRFAASRRRGVIGYAENILQKGLTYKPERYDIVIGDDTYSYEALLITCANASQYGNNAYIAPQASMSDGMLDVTVVEPLDLFEASQASIEMFNKTLNQNAKIKTYRAKELIVRRAEQGYIHYDGDPVMAGRELHIAIHERGINVVVNPSGDKSLRQPNTIQTAVAQLFNNVNLLRRTLQEQIKSMQP